MHLMSTHQQARLPMQNRLLANLPSEELTALHPHMEQVSLSHGQVIILPYEPIPFVYFPVNLFRGIPHPPMRWG